MSSTTIDEIHSDGMFDYVNVDPHRLVYTIGLPVPMVSNSSPPIPYSNTHHLSPTVSNNQQQQSINNPLLRSRSSSTHSNSPSSSSLSNYHTNILLHNNSPRNTSPRQINTSSPPQQQSLSSTFQQQAFQNYQQHLAPTFLGQLPLPPGSNLFKIRSSLVNNSKIEENERSEMELEILENVKIVKESFGSNEKIPIRIGLTKKDKVDDETLPQSVKPYNSVRLFENSLGYVYEDHWNVEESRPLLCWSLISPSSLPEEKEILKETTSTESLENSEQKVVETISQTNQEETNQEEEEGPSNEKQDNETNSTSTSIEETIQDEKEEETTIESSTIYSTQHVETQDESNNVKLLETLDSKSSWRTRVLEKYPVMLELQERIYPLWRTISFGELFNAGQKQVRENLTEDITLNIIMQHLRFEGLKQTRSALEEETKRKYLDIDVQQSLLHALSKEAVKKTERLHDLVIFDKFQHSANIQKNKNVITKALEERLNDLGINEFGNVTESEKENMSKWKEIVGAGQNEILHVDPVKKYEQFQAGTLGRIIERLISSTDQQISFVDVFLHTYLSLISAETVLNRLVHKFKNLPKNHSQESRNNIQSGALKFLHYWMEQHAQHFTNNMIIKVEKLLNESQSNTSPKFIKIRKDILQYISNNQTKKIPIVNNVNYIEPKVPMQKIFCSTLSLDDIDEEEIARQLTLYEYDLFVAIGLEELMSFGWKRLKFKHRSPNVLNLLNHFDNITMWIHWSICKPKSKNPIKRCINICEHLRKLNNFNTLKAILNGFEFGEMKTLKIGQNELAIKSKLSQLMSEENNYQEYRLTLKETADNTSIIPYVKVHLRDLYLVEENQNDFVIGPNSIELISWIKRESMYDIVKEIKHLQSLPYYPFTKVYQIQELIRNIQFA